jgi:predicted Zn-dependent protease
VALAINPLHYQTHWHWGNGHTNLTYADYAEKEDDSVREVLKKADTLIRSNKVEAAIEFTRQVEKKYPSSVLPLLHRGSIYYSAFDMSRPKRLDSAQHIFEMILARKKHFGPAHNGLSAVIKSKRIAYLAAFDSINNSLNTTQINDPGNFEKVFPDLSYYSGNMAKAMVWKQMYASVVYFPFLSRLGNSFRIPPLHIDLATCMSAPYFRFMTTFDNRQWMDIRGVGSGAAAIEYVERGAFLERNVVLHEYVHLFHYSVLTDEEQRAIRKHYYTAMQENRTLDYYSRNNESEYFAQTYPAYFEPVKVHPLDFKSMNTSSDLKAKDPGMYQFLDEMVKKQEAYLKGDKKAMAGNWAQIYLNLSNRIVTKDKKLAAAYLDSALIFDNRYLPVYIGYAQLKISEGDHKAAEDWLRKASAINRNYGPLYVAYAELVNARQSAGEVEYLPAIRQQAEYLQKSLKIEDDFQEKADVSFRLSETYRKNGWIAEAIQTAELYEKNAATVSTYLRDRKDDAAAYAASLKSMLGYPEPLAVLKKLVEQKPQNYEYRNLYADALAANKRYNEAIAILLQAQRILASANNARVDYNLRIAEYYHALNKKDSVGFYLEPFLSGKTELGTDQLRLVRLLAGTGNMDRANLIFKESAVSGDRIYLSEYYYSKARLEEAADKNAMAADFEKAIGLNPYGFTIYNELMQYYAVSGLTGEWEKLKKKLDELKIKPGPVFSF